MQGGKPAKPEGGPADFVALDETRSRLLYFKPCADVEDGISVPKRQLLQFPNMHVTKKMMDSHLYIFSRFDPSLSSPFLALSPFFSLSLSLSLAHHQVDRARFRSTVTHFQRARTARHVAFLAGVRFGDKALADVLSHGQLEQIAGALEQETFACGEHIIRQGQEGDYFYIVEDGEVGIYKTGVAGVAGDGPGNGTGAEESEGGPIAVLRAGAYFGEKALLAEDKRQASCVAETAVRCLTLGRDDFVMMLGSLEDLISGASGASGGGDDGDGNGGGAESFTAGESAPGGSGGAAASDKAASDCTSDSTGVNDTVANGGTDIAPPQDGSDGSGAVGEAFSFDNLVVVRTLGCGAFGRVKLVQSTADGRTFALKCQGKRAIVENGLEEHVLNERTILASLRHPFILTCHGAFKDTHSIYFVLELLQGGELFTQLRLRGQLEEREAKFYAAQVLLAFQHMHAKNVAYRDLKPENLVLDSEGYLKVVDFGLAKVVDGKTWTLCGTPDYLAPEIILNEGHDKAVDYWALGVLVYEMVAGLPPFYADDPMDVYEKILSARVSMPHHFSKNLADLVRKLCKLYQSKRLGNGKGGTAAIQKHKWFSTFDFKGLIKRELAPPIRPVVGDNLDASNFDDYEAGAEPENPPVSAALAAGCAHGCT